MVWASSFIWKSSLEVHGISSPAIKFESMLLLTPTAQIGLKTA